MESQPQNPEFRNNPENFPSCIPRYLVRIYTIIAKTIGALLAFYISFPPGKSFILFCLLLIFFKINFFQKLFQEYQLSVKQIESRSGRTFCRTWSGSKLFAKVISRRRVNSVLSLLSVKPTTLILLKKMRATFATHELITLFQPQILKFLEYCCFINN